MIIKDRYSCIIFVGIDTNNTPKVYRIADALNSYTKGCHVFTLTKLENRIGCHHTSYHYGRKTCYRTALAFAIGFLTITIKILREKPRIIYAIDPFAGMIAILVTAIKRGIYFYESLEIFCDSSSFLFSGKLKKFWYVIERQIARNAKAFIATDQYRMRFLRRYYKIHPDKCFFLLNTPPKPTLLPDPYSLKKKSPSAIVFSYAGMILEDRCIEMIFKCMADLPENVGLVMIGAGNEYYTNKLKELSHQLKISNKISWLGKFDNNDLRLLLSETDCTFALYDNNCLTNRFCSPNKIFDALYSGVLTICTHSYLTRDVIQQHGVGLVIDKVNHKDLLHAMRRVIEMLTKSPDIRFYCTSLALTKYNWENESKKVRYILDKYI